MSEPSETPKTPETPSEPKSHRLDFNCAAILIVLFVMGITIGITAVCNSKTAQCDRNIKELQETAERFLQECPEDNRINCIPSDMQFMQFEKFINEYMRGEVEFASTHEDSPKGYLTAQTLQNDPWGNPYTILFTNRKLEEDTLESQGHTRIFIRSRGYDGSNFCNVVSVFESPDDNDRISLTQVDNDKVVHKEWISKDRRSYWDYGYDYSSNTWKDLAYKEIQNRLQNT